MDRDEMDMDVDEQLELILERVGDQLSHNERRLNELREMIELGILKVRDSIRPKAGKD